RHDAAHRRCEKHVPTRGKTSSLRLWRIMKNVVLLGSTGSIGTSTIKVAEDLPNQIRLIGLAAGANTKLLAEQARRHKPQAISVTDPAAAAELQKTFGK